MTESKIQWYPGHIAKAEKQLSKNLGKVDLIIEVRDARIPISTSHPHLNQWIQGKKHLLVINRRDMISKKALHCWDQFLRQEGHSPWWCNAKDGIGVKQLKEAAIKAGEAINARRRSKGMRNRPIRALTLGFPNVGKSALINRLVRKKVVMSHRKAGVTRSLRWVRLDQDLDLLDAPGVLPTKLDDQKAALKLALCDDIGQAAYEVEAVAIAFLEMIQLLDAHEESGVSRGLIENRYGLPLEESNLDINQWLIKIAIRHTSGDVKRMAQRLLDDFRKSLLGNICLELP